MTKTHDRLAAVIDTQPEDQINELAELRKAVFQSEEAAGASGDEELARELSWERGIIDLVVPPKEHYSLFRGADYDRFAEFYGFTDQTLDYARRVSFCL